MQTEAACLCAFIILVWPHALFFVGEQRVESAIRYTSVNADDDGVPMLPDGTKQQQLSIVDGLTLSGHIHGLVSSKFAVLPYTPSVTLPVVLSGTQSRNEKDIATGPPQ